MAQNGAEWILLLFVVANEVVQQRCLEMERQSHALGESTFVVAIDLRLGEDVLHAPDVFGGFFHL